jgi:hypothetical protein
VRRRSATRFTEGEFYSGFPRLQRQASPIVDQRSVEITEPSMGLGAVEEGLAELGAR